ncbi:MAG: FHA domain-containing protein [Oscillospiraceae bacterium]|nr:FHA domain-containing protein [Oscillospiraceae bacterium]
MAKFKIKIKDNQVFLKSKLSKNESINQKEVDVFNSKLIRGLMRPKIEGDKKIDYNAPASIVLTDYLHSGITKNDFFVVFAQFVECLKKIQWNKFSPSNLVLDTNLIFFNTYTKEVQFVYQPIFSCESHNNLYFFIYDMVGKTFLVPGESRMFLDDLVRTIQNMPLLSAQLLEDYIINNYPQIYKQVHRSKPGESQHLNNSGMNYFAKKYGESASPNNSSSGYTNGSGSSGGSSSRPDSGFETEPTTLLVTNATTLLNNEGTDLYTNQQQSYPYLIRMNNYEKVFVDKPVFRIGKEKSYVDYFVMSNSAVSRIHADIISENGHYFIKDNNSTNHTFINGSMIPTNEKIEIHDGDAVMFANEPFEFHIK